MFVSMFIHQVFVSKMVHLVNIACLFVELFGIIIGYYIVFTLLTYLYLRAPPELKNQNI